MWNTWAAHLLALTCLRSTETKLAKASLSSNCLLRMCTFPSSTSILHLLMSVMKGNNSSGCSCTRHPAKQNAWRGSSQCFAEHSSLEIHMVRCSSQHLHTMKWILDCAWEHPKMIIASSKMSAMSARCDLKNAFFSPKVLPNDLVWVLVLGFVSGVFLAGVWFFGWFGFGVFLVLILLAMQILEITMPNKRRTEPLCPYNLTDPCRRNKPKGESWKGANLMYSETLVGMCIHCHDIAFLQKSINR